MSIEEDKSKVEGAPSDENRAFLTSLADPNDTKQNAHFVSLNIMQKCVDNIGPQFQQVLKNHEEDFMAAYRVSFISFLTFLRAT
jgi:hypothetical protein